MSIPLDRKLAVVRRIESTAGSPATTPTNVVKSMAKHLEVAESTLYRWKKGEGLTVRQPMTLDREELICITQNQGNLTAAWKQLCAEGKLDIGYEAFTRRLHNTDTDTKAAVLEGMPAALGKSLFNTYGPVPKMNTVAFDHKEIPVFVVDEKTGDPKKVWITLIIEYLTRWIFRPVITEGDGIKGDPNTEAVVAQITGVLIGEEVEGFPGLLIGGLFENIRCDNALAHLANAVVHGHASLGIVPHFIRPASPWENGRIERVMRTSEVECYSTLPGYSHHLETRYGHSPWTPEDLLTVDELSAEIENWRFEYNTRRPHEALGDRTPLQAWLDDPTVVETVDPALVRHAYLAVSGTRKISKNGVHFDGIDYQSIDFSGKVGRTVTIRHLPNDRSFIDVYLGDEFLTTAEPAAHLAPEQKARIARIRRNRTARLDRIIKTGARRAAAAAMERADREGFADPASKSAAQAEQTSTEAESPMEGPTAPDLSSDDEDLEAYLEMSEAAKARREEVA